MKQRILLGWLLGALSLSATSADAREEFFQLFLKDPLRLNQDPKCNTCHVAEEGGGERNDFGTAFDEAGRTITPILRASFPDVFGFYSTRLADGSAFYFSDPENETVVFERDGEKYLIDLAEIAVKPEDIIPPPANRMTFFITSVSVGNGGHLEGLAGADRHCQELAEEAGAGDLTWRAYLSTSFGDRPAVNAGDRIGTGPWFNAKHQLVARGVAELHSNGRLTRTTALTEKGEPVEAVAALDGSPQIDVLTGTLGDGTAAIGKNCNNWTSNSEGTAMLGRLDGDDVTSWSSAHEPPSCRQEDLEPTGGGRFYCFAIR